ncbi:hypothetical protein QE369_003839 [Agrobacterium larrymoorei]|uniref:Uncharacterized protein n=2 Tax=Agrobacterium larrymoorei TaxID=160699 RepID=A0AAJ2BET4_9HYPH|nr:hypothetical protein [Agrobacterium larrymoorei]
MSIFCYICKVDDGVKPLASVKKKAHIRLDRKVWTMQGIRTFFIAASSIAVLALAALFTASLTIALVGTLAVLSIAKMFSSRLKPEPIRVKTQDHRQQNMRVWNDGRGTIIDL